MKRLILHQAKMADDDECGTETIFGDFFEFSATTNVRLLQRQNSVSFIPKHTCACKRGVGGSAVAKNDV
jgi:hypothetical protein